MHFAVQIQNTYELWSAITDNLRSLECKYRVPVDSLESKHGVPMDSEVQVWST